jgi:hypothetical protein
MHIHYDVCGHDKSSGIYDAHVFIVYLYLFGVIFVTLCGWVQYGGNRIADPFFNL